MRTLESMFVGGCELSSHRASRIFDDDDDDDDDDDGDDGDDGDDDGGDDGGGDDDGGGGDDDQDIPRPFMKRQQHWILRWESTFWKMLEESKCSEPRSGSESAEDWPNCLGHSPGLKGDDWSFQGAEPIQQHCKSIIINANHILSDVSDTSGPEFSPAEVTLFENTLVQLSN